MEEGDDIKSLKSIYIAVSVIGVLILVGWFIYLTVAKSKEKWPFQPYEPPTMSDPHLYYINGADSEVPLTNEADIEKRRALIDQALIDVRLHMEQSAVSNSYAKPTYNTS